MVRSCVAWCAIGLVALSACTNQADVSSLRSELETVKLEIAAVRDSLESFQRLRRLEDYLRDTDKMAYLTPADEGYSVIRTDLGVMTVSLSDVQPYANGSRVALQFGNPLGATITGGKARLEWGRVNAEGYAEYGGARSREVSFVEPIRAGAWNRIHVTLDGVPPTELGFVRVSNVTHSAIRLSR